jgi:hypothetical protein
MAEGQAKALLWWHGEVARLDAFARATLEPAGYRVEKIGRYYSVPFEHGEALLEDTRPTVVLARFIIAALPDISFAIEHSSDGTTRAMQLLSLCASAVPRDEASPYIQALHNKRAATAPRPNAFARLLEKFASENPRISGKQLVRSIEELVSIENAIPQGGTILSVTDSEIEWEDEQGHVHSTSLSSLGAQLSRLRKKLSKTQ